MRTNRKIKVITIALLLIPVGISHLLSINYDNFQWNPLAANDCLWNHYDPLEESLNHNGCHEYWVCCTHRHYTLETPVDGLITHVGTPSVAFADNLADDDPRVKLSYHKQADILDTKINQLSVESQLNFDDMMTLNQIEHTYQNMNETTRGLLENLGSWQITKDYFSLKYPRIFDTPDHSFAPREYASTFDLTRQNDAQVGNFFSLTNIQGNDTFWIYPNSSQSIDQYQTINYLIRADEALTVEFRSKVDYGYKFRKTLNPGTWELFSVNPATYGMTTLNEIGIAIWRGAPYALTATLDISAFYGVSDYSLNSTKIFDATTDDIGPVNYSATYTVTRGHDSVISEDYLMASNITNTNDGLWLGPNKDISIKTYDKIYFYFKCSLDLTIEVRERHNYHVDQIIHLKANEWRRVVIAVNQTNFPNWSLKDIGLDHWGSHTPDTAGSWSFSSMYGLREEEMIDGMVVPKFSSNDIIDFTAYAIAPSRSAAIANQVFATAKSAGFTKAIGLYDGRNHALQEEYRTALQNYLAWRFWHGQTKKTNLENALRTAIDNFCAAIHEANTYTIEAAYDQGIKYYALNCILYDFREFAGDETYTAENYNFVIERILEKSLYMDNSKYFGDFYFDEPATNDNFDNIASFYSKYSVRTDGEALINLLPIENLDVKSKYQTYLDNYMSKVYSYTNYISFDHYPILKTGLGDTHLLNLEMVANSLKTNNGTDLRTFIWSNKETADNPHAGIDALEDLSLQIYANLAFGSKDIAYFCYTSNADSDSDTGSLVNYINYETSNIFTYATTINNHVHELENAYNHFTWDQIMTVGSCTQFSNLDHAVTSYGKLTSASSDQNTLIGCFKDMNDNNSFLVMNYQNTNVSNNAATINLHFNNANYAIVYHNGTKHLHPLSSGTLTFNLAAAHGALIIPISC